VALEALNRETVAEVAGVVFGLHKTSLYVKGVVTPSRESLLHSAIYEQKQDVNSIFYVHDKLVTGKAGKSGILCTEVEQPVGSQELAQEAVKLLKFNKDVKCFVLKKQGIIALGTTFDEAGKLVEAVSTKLQNSGKEKVGRKKRTA
jgi:ribulose-5-phosphate 4-epimerase/fuculose-1-phosphate aldolase